jgi:methylmalonyl-CoA mutase N-terminal domain/subunit
VRVAIQALAAVLGGTQSLHTNSMDEALALPSEHAVTLALRTQQVIAEETGVTNTVDPLGGSYFVEALTDQTENAVYAYLRKIDAIGGVIPALERGYMQQEIADASYREQLEMDAGRRRVVGVNAYADDVPLRIPLLEMDAQGYARQVARLETLRRTRNQAAAEQALNDLREVCAGTANVMPALLACAHAGCTLGEMVDVMRVTFGVYREPVGV